MTHAIIGAGIVGLSTAMELLSRGVPAGDITVFDPAPISGATRAAGGMLAPVAEVQYQQEALYPLMVKSAQRFPQAIARLEKYTTLEVGYRSESTFVVAADRADSTHLRELSDHQNRHGMEVIRLPLRQARKKEPGLHPNLAGVVEIPGDHQLNPRLYCQALLDALQTADINLIPREVTDITDLAAETIYLCNGLGAAHITGFYEGPTNPLALRAVRGDMLRLRVPGSRPMPVGRVLRGFVEDRPIYIIPRTDRTIAVGATSREDERVLPAVDGVHQLLRDALRILPGLAECEFLDAATGDRPGTPDDLPYLGLVGPNVVVSTGYFRHGILLSALGAKAAADLGLTGTTDINISACAPLRHARREENHETDH